MQKIDKNKDLLILRNNSSLIQTEEFFFNESISFYSNAISKSEPLDIQIKTIDAEIILVTSQNALDFVEHHFDILKNKKIYCLNKCLFKKAKALCLRFKGWNNTSELASYIIKNENNSNKIIHLCADNANKLFYSKLESAGFKINSLNVYETKFINELSDDVIKALSEKQIKYVMIFSKASLNHLKTLFKQYNLNLADYKLLCFSKRIADQVSEYYVTESTLSAMLSLYKKTKGVE